MRKIIPQNSGTVTPMLLTEVMEFFLIIKYSIKSGVTMPTEMSMVLQFISLEKMII